MQNQSSRRKAPVRRQTEIVSPPIREGHRVACGTEESEIEYEDDDLGTAVKGRGDYVVVFREPAWVARAHPPLREDAERHVRVDGRVQADGHVGRVLHDDGRVDVLETCLRPESVLHRKWDVSGWFQHLEGLRTQK